MISLKNPRKFLVSFFCMANIFTVVVGQENEDKLVLTLMKKENLAQVFGEDAVKRAVVFNEVLQKYEGELSAKISSIHDRPSIEVPIFIGNMDVLNAAGFRKRAPTLLIVHGFMDNYSAGPGLELSPGMKEKYLREIAYLNSTKQPLNIILVDWSDMARIHKAKSQNQSDILYFPPARNAELVGNQTGILIEFLVSAGAKLEDFHLIGHGLGAHALGWTGKHLQAKLGKNVPRITALDPTGPCYERHSPVCFSGQYRSIKKTDAEFVDVIHTHARALGMKAPVGHVDFYPNGGFTQPGCQWYTFGQCSHRRAVDFFAQSIANTQFSFMAQQCINFDEFIQGNCHSTNFALLGEHCTPRARGVYFLKLVEKNTGQQRFIL